MYSYKDDFERIYLNKMRSKVCIQYTVGVVTQPWPGLTSHTCMIIGHGDILEWFCLISTQLSVSLFCDLSKLNLKSHRIYIYIHVYTSLHLFYYTHKLYHNNIIQYVCILCVPIIIFEGLSCFIPHLHIHWW